MRLSKPLGKLESVGSKLMPKTQCSPGFSKPIISPSSEIIDAKKVSDNSFWKILEVGSKSDFTHPEPPIICESFEPGLKKSWGEKSTFFIFWDFLPPKKYLSPQIHFLFLKLGCFS